MKYLHYPLLAIILVSCCGGMNLRSADSQYLFGENAINLCVEKYLNLKGLQEFMPYVDRAYVHISKNDFGVIFARGEVGTFGPRSAKYSSFLSCGLSKLGSDFTINYLGSYLETPLIDSEYSNQTMKSFYDNHVIELLFKRKKGGFVFCKSQLFVEPEQKIEKKDSMSID